MIKIIKMKKLLKDSEYLLNDKNTIDKNLKNYIK